MTAAATSRLHAVGHQNGAIGRDEHLLRVAAGHVGPGHPGTDSVGTGPGGRDRARPLGARHVRHVAGVGRKPLPPVDVGEVDPGRRHVDQKLPGAGRGGVAFGQPEHFRPAMPFGDDCTHTPILSLGRGQRGPVPKRRHDHRAG